MSKIRQALRSLLPSLLPVFAIGLAHLPVQAAESAALTAQAMIDVNKLASEEMAGRATDSKGSALARDYIISRLQQLGLTPCKDDFVHEFEFQTRQGASRKGKNIITCSPGSMNGHASAPVLAITAHYDHLGEKGGKIYHGADDNASGVAAVLAIAAAMKENPSQHDLMYILFDAEEMGLSGSRAFAAKPVMDMARIGMNMNFDMIARGDKGELYASGAYHTPALKNLLASLDGTQGVKLKFGHDRPEQGQDDWTKQSDHLPFFLAGVPHIYFGVEDHADYHQPTDTADKINPQFYLGVVDLLTKASYLLDQAMLTTDFRNKSKDLQAAGVAGANKGGK
ncbi:M20/M25/M40 family metallo-hydrolase [Undibacterium sp. TC9W]|uniref:M20/M25/M40 family metallo-hydrolase n=1 Tax=Undibacterium sp. TC9W TaxID=3413053 RepID=UPI003BF3067E